MGPSLSLLTALAVLAAALVPVWRELRLTRTVAAKAAEQAATAAERAAEVHSIVNQQRTDMQVYTEVLRAALVAAGVAVPPDASLRPKPPDS